MPCARPSRRASSHCASLSTIAASTARTWASVHHGKVSHVSPLAHSAVTRVAFFIVLTSESQTPVTRRTNLRMPSVSLAVNGPSAVNSTSTAAIISGRASHASRRHVRHSVDINTASFHASASKRSCGPARAAAASRSSLATGGPPMTTAAPQTVFVSF
jgi:hypothetical protein